MKPKLKCEIYKPQGLHKGPEQKERERSSGNIDSKDKHKNDSVAEHERERKKRQDNRGYLQVPSWLPKDRVAQDIADKTRRAGCGGQL